MTKLAFPLTLLAAVAAVAGAAGCERQKYTPTECTVWTEKEGSVTGTVYMNGGNGSFTAGGTRSRIAYMNAARNVVVLSQGAQLEAASFDGKIIRITYLPDAKFVSHGFENGTVVLASDQYRTEFFYNSLCTATDVAVGAVTLFTTIFPPGQPASL